MRTCFYLIRKITFTNLCKPIHDITIIQWRQWRCSGVFIVNFKHISHLFSSISIVDFEQVNVSWVLYLNIFTHWSSELVLSLFKVMKKIPGLCYLMFYWWSLLLTLSTLSNINLEFLLLLWTWFWLLGAQQRLSHRSITIGRRKKIFTLIRK